MYQVLYRKYRPKVFSDVYGQDHVTSTLRNEITAGRISHAYLFTGSRGTGKTTCAKILAKAVNCENSQNGEPCNECEVCKGLDNGSIFDVVEIDAASNNSVDNVRDLREDVKYTPSRGKYRVYIIDEVHMLSAGAFNALLKTLEEPPEHVIFILATTEVHKLPATILSRCQRFDFKRIPPEIMAERLSEVSEKENLSLDSDAAILIARIDDGALRDGLSILDQCAGRSKHVTSELVSEVAGIAGREALFQLSDSIAEKNSSNAIDIVSSLYENSYDMERLCVEMINHIRNFLVVKTVKKSRELIICTDDEYNKIKESANAFTIENVLHMLDVFQDTLVRIKSGSAARIEVEMALVKLCEPKLDEDIASVLDRLSTLERAVRSGVSVSVKPEVKAEVKEEVNEEKEEVPVPPAFEEEDEPEIESPKEDEPAEEEPAEEPKAEEVAPPPVEEKPAPVEAKQPSAPEQTAFESWGEFIDELRKLDITLFGILNDAKGFVRDDVFLIDSPNPTIKDFIQKNNSARTIKQALYNVTGNKYKLGLFKRRVEPEFKRDPLEDLISHAQSKMDITIKD